MSGFVHDERALNGPTRRAVVRGLAAASAARASGQGTAFDVAVIGAGVFGSWTAHHLRRAGKRVVLIDGYGAASSRASSGGESRIIRCAYGGDEIYSRFAQRSLGQWKELSRRVNSPLFQQTGVLHLGGRGDTSLTATAGVLAKLGVTHQQLSQAELAKRFPQFFAGDIDQAIFEPESGALMARRSVQMLVQDMSQSGLELVLEPVVPPAARDRMESVKTAGGRTISAGAFVFACGPWLPKVFPAELGQRIFPTRQEIFFFGVPGGERRFRPPAMPCWIDPNNLYGIPDLENRGFKIADDEHGPAIDPDAADRLVPKESLAAMRRRLAGRFPALKDAPLLETRVCQYENSANGDFLLDRHPSISNVWLAGGGSGHGFKHGPAVGEYLAARILGTQAGEPRFSFASKGTVQKRSVY
ncbi:MAG: FAD-dependent oxidoreductase [Acidobacteria bacterium]|nr:FAD-dependent oxidoreductase [Acidobacteriota bacterium]